MPNGLAKLAKAEGIDSKAVDTMYDDIMDLILDKVYDDFWIPRCNRVADWEKNHTQNISVEHKSTAASKKNSMVPI